MVVLLYLPTNIIISQFKSHEDELDILPFEFENWKLNEKEVIVHVNVVLLLALWVSYGIEYLLIEVASHFVVVEMRWWY